MAFEHQSMFGLWTSNLFQSAVNFVRGLTGQGQFSPEETLADAKNIDPRLIPKVPMTATDIDANLLVQLGKMGMKRGKLVTAESHPELMAAWKTMSVRAGLCRTPQLIIVESPIINAMTVSPEEVVVTTGLLKKLDLREVSAVLGHELGHANSDHKTPRIAAMAIFSTLGALAAHRWRHGGAEAIEAAKGTTQFSQAADELLTVMVGGSLGNVVANQISVKPTEFQADLKGAAISGDPQGLINALHKLEANHKRSPLLRLFAGLQSGYPTTEQRIANLQRIAAAMPAITIPEPVTVMPKLHAQHPGVKVSQIAADERIEAETPCVALS